MRDGVVMLTWMNQQLIRNRAPRQLRRQMLRDLQKNPDNLIHLLPWLYPGEDVR